MLPELYSSTFQAGAELVFTYRQTAVLRKESGEVVIPDLIDFDLSGDPSKYLNQAARNRLDRYPIRSQDQAIDRFLKIREDLDPDSEDGELLRAKIFATTLFLKARTGTKYNPRVYIESTLGVEEKGSHLVTTEIPEKDISRMWEQVAGDFANCSDLTLARDGRQTWEKFIRENRVRPSGVVYRDLEEVMVPIMQEVLGMRERPNYIINFTSVDDYWLNWTDKGPYGFRLQINTHDRARDRYFKGVEERMFVHEILTHAFQAHSFAENIRREKINPGYGILVIPSPCQWHSESLAETLAYFIPQLYSRLSNFARFAINFRLYETWIQRNAHLAANGLIESIGDRKKVSAYLLDNLPNMNTDRAERFIGEVTNSPRDISYRLAYGGSYEHWLYAQRLTPPKDQGTTEDPRVEFVRRSMEYPRTPSQVEEMVERLEAMLLKPVQEPELPKREQGGLGEMIGRILPNLQRDLSRIFYTPH